MSGGSERQCETETAGKREGRRRFRGAAPIVGPRGRTYGRVRSVVVRTVELNSPSIRTFDALIVPEPKSLR